MRRALALSILAVTGLVGTATAGTSFPAIKDFVGGGGPFTSFYGSAAGDVVGFRFTADASLTVTHLGILNDPIDGLLDSAHMIGLWRDSDQALLASASVDSTGMVVGDFLYEPLPATVALVAGESYTLGALYTSLDGDGYFSGPSSITLNSISNTIGVFPDVAELGFVYPGSESPGNLGRIGPNMLLIPGPGALALLGLGVLAPRRRRRA